MNVHDFLLIIVPRQFQQHFQIVMHYVLLCPIQALLFVFLQLLHHYSLYFHWHHTLLPLKYSSQVLLFCYTIFWFLQPIIIYYYINIITSNCFYNSYILRLITSSFNFLSMSALSPLLTFYSTLLEVSFSFKMRSIASTLWSASMVCNTHSLSK